MNAPLEHHWAFARPRLSSNLPIKLATRIISAALCLSSGYVSAACEQEAAALCPDGNPRCLADAAKSVEQAANDCKSVVGRFLNASMWQETPQFFDNSPHERVFWRCVARQCDDPQEPGK
ncbi:hypothetical protein [Paraburkholderia pallida]|uniref:Lipoprotein n=1 Tax=Paraburkholderia pallida TaxID=2547399 RepID=A0A4P7D5I5_9BURK|nr:hypothetical protein [Paraburkholderia pallida]QBR02180.1 hypothetical protein E1956_34295 [Paraburkholderia pallida]